jgi:hypothetical protein
MELNLWTAVCRTVTSCRLVGDYQLFGLTYLQNQAKFSSETLVTTRHHNPKDHRSVIYLFVLVSELSRNKNFLFRCSCFVDLNTYLVSSLLIATNLCLSHNVRELCS